MMKYKEKELLGKEKEPKKTEDSAPEKIKQCEQIQTADIELKVFAFEGFLQECESDGF